jgi:uncharacterized protein YbgA (DUF1722 family)/uncharacterized protein YbbK (DUF523 family)
MVYGVSAKFSERPQIGASACLARQAVRFDGGFIANQFLNNDCMAFFDVHTICPEVELGLGIPRPAIQLRQFNNEIRLVFSKNPEQDLTRRMHDYAERRVKHLPPLDGYIFKKDSPSCGVFKVAVVNNETGMRQRNGIGLFAATFSKTFPHVPVEEEGRLNDPAIRENFLERVYAHFRWRQLMTSPDPLQGFRDYHRNYKLMLMAKDNAAYRRLGRLAASVNGGNFHDVSASYFGTFMQAMARIPSQGNHVNVMMHILGYLKNQLDKKDKAELLQWFETYRNKRVDRVAPLMLLQHHFKKFHNDYIAEQYYFSPFPGELMLPV